MDNFLLLNKQIAALKVLHSEQHETGCRPNKKYRPTRHRLVHRQNTCTQCRQREETVEGNNVCADSKNRKIAAVSPS